MIIYGKMAELVKAWGEINFLISVCFDINRSMLDSSVKLPTSDTRAFSWVCLL